MINKRNIKILIVYSINHYRSQDIILKLHSTLFYEDNNLTVKSNLSYKIDYHFQGINFLLDY